MGDAWIIDAARTPRGKVKQDTGSLSGIHPQELLGQCLNALRDRHGFNPAHVEDVVAGCVSDVNFAIMGVTGGGLDGNNPHLKELHPMAPQGISADRIATVIERLQETQ